MLVFFSVNSIINAIAILLLIILIILVISTIVFLLTTIKINVKYINKNYKIIIKLYLLKKIRYFKLEIDKNKILELLKTAKVKIEKKQDKKITKELYQDRKILKEVVKNLKIDLEYINLDLKVGTEFILLTSVIITTISTIFPMIANKFIRKYDEKKYQYKFTPIYNKNDFNLYLDCIISTKMVHIINVIVRIIFKKGDLKNVRTSNTRFNDNCYE